MATVISEECAAIAFYGIDIKGGSLSGFYRRVVQWFRDLGHPADKLGVTGPGHSGKPVSFARGDAKLQKTGFNGVRAFDIHSLLPDAQIPLDDYLLTASCSAKYSYACVVSRSSIVPLSRSAMLPFAQDIIQSVKPAYGIGYNRDHRLGPAMYAVGICHGLGPGGYGVGLSEVEREEADSISNWGDAMAARVWQKGILRDVYPWTFLTGPQLARQVGGMPLEQWIRQDARRGTLEPLRDGVFLWEVNEPDLPHVRAEIRQAGAVFDWKKHL